MKVKTSREEMVKEIKELVQSNKKVSKIYVKWLEKSMVLVYNIVIY